MIGKAVLLSHFLSLSYCLEVAAPIFRSESHSQTRLMAQKDFENPNLGQMFRSR